MNMEVNNVAYVETVDDSHLNAEVTLGQDIIISEPDETFTLQNKSNKNEGAEKNSAIWTTNATLTLLKLYETKLEMLETPKKKTRIWIAISDNLKEYNVEMSPDQVRWKINALAKKYKQCIDSGQHDKFKFYKEMENIYAQYNVDCDSHTIQNAELIQKKKISRRYQQISATNETADSIKSNPESKTMIKLRKLRLAKRIESDRSQSKINLEKQWLEYLKREEEQKKMSDEINDRHLKLREEELELRKKELEMKESIEMRKLELREREQEAILLIEREKCEMLKKIFLQQHNHYN